MDGPCYPAECLGGTIVDGVDGEYLCDHPGVGANAAGGDDHAHAAVNEHDKGGEDAEVVGIGEAEETEVDLPEVHEPYEDGVENELAALFHMEDGEHAVGKLFHEAAKFGFLMTAINDNCRNDEEGEDGEGKEKDVLVVVYLLFEVFHHIGDEVGYGGELEHESEHGGHEEAKDIEGALCHDGADHFMSGHLLVLGEDGAFGYLAAAGYGEVGDVAYEHCHGCIGEGGVHAGGLEEVSPADCPEKVGQEADNENREGIPEVDLVE